MSQKEKMVRAIASLPNDATFDDGMDAVVLLVKLNRAYGQIAAGKTIPHEEVRARLATWLK